MCGEVGHRRLTREVIRSIEWITVVVTIGYVVAVDWSVWRREGDSVDTPTKIVLSDFRIEGV